MFFRQSRILSGAVLAIFLVALGLPFITPQHHWGDDVDAGWGDVQVSPGHPVSQVEQVYPAHPNDHCAVCHLARAFRTSIPAVPGVHVPSVVSNLPDATDHELRILVSVSAASPRGPPTSL